MLRKPHRYLKLFAGAGDGELNIYVAPKRIIMRVGIYYTNTERYLVEVNAL